MDVLTQRLRSPCCPFLCTYAAAVCAAQLPCCPAGLCVITSGFVLQYPWHKCREGGKTQAGRTTKEQLKALPVLECPS